MKCEGCDYADCFGECTIDHCFYVGTAERNELFGNGGNEK